MRAFFDKYTHSISFHSGVPCVRVGFFRLSSRTFHLVTIQIRIVNQRLDFGVRSIIPSSIMAFLRLIQLVLQLV